MTRITGASIAALLTVAPILILTLVPGEGADPSPALCLVCGYRGTADLLLNVLLFVPMGAALRLRGWSLTRVLLTGATLSLAIECAQVLLPGRSPTARDVLVNALGAWLGALAVAFLAVPRSSRVARAALAACAIAPLAAIAATGWLLAPADPSPDAPLFGQWAPRFQRLGHWDGEIAGVRIGGRDVPSRRLPGGVARTFALPVRIDASAGTPRGPRAPILGLADEKGDHVLLVAQERGDLVLVRRRRSTLIALDAPTTRFPGMLAVPAGTALVIELDALDGLRPCASVNGGARRCEPAPSVGRGWALLQSMDALPAALVRALDAAFLAALLLPAGLLLHAAHAREAAAGALALAVMAVALARTTGLGDPGLLEFVAAATGLAAGAFASPARRRRRQAGPSVPPIDVNS